MDTIFMYVDPGTGATLTQLLLAGSVGVAAVVKLKWYSIKSFFNRSDSSSGETEEATADEEDSVGQR